MPGGPDPPTLHPKSQEVTCFLVILLPVILLSLSPEFLLLPYLRGFPATGPLIRMVLEICRSMRAFLLLLGIVFVGFSAAFTVLFQSAWSDSYYVQHGHRMPFETVGRSAFTLFKILLGDFDTDMFEVSE